MYCPACGESQSYPEGTVRGARRYEKTAMALMFFTGMRGLTHLVLLLTSANVTEGLLFLAYVAVYTASLVGVYRGKAWGPQLLLGFVSMDSLFSLILLPRMIGDVYAVAQIAGGLTVNLILIYLAYKEYRRIRAPDGLNL
jgi:hypothetical protein